MRHWGALFILLAVPFTQGAAMKPYRPDVLKFESADKKQSLSIPMPPKKAVLQWNDKKYKWPKLENPHPGEVLFNVPQKQVILLGGLGDPGIHLGDVVILSVEGKRLSAIDLKTALPDLETLSREDRDMSNFPWISATQFEPAGKTLSIWVCHRRAVTIDLTSFTVTVQPSTDPSAWESGSSSH